MAEKGLNGKWRGFGFAAEPLLYVLSTSVRKPAAPWRVQPENGTRETGMEINLRRAIIQQKRARLEAVLQKIEAFVTAGGDLKSPTAIPDGMEFVNALAELAEEFGCEILKAISERTVKPERLFWISVAGRS